MKIANVKGRLSLVVQDTGRSFTYVDVARASGGRFSSDPQLVFKVWDAFVKWGRNPDLSDVASAPMSDLHPPVPLPRQVFAIGMNYKPHADELGRDLPSQPSVFTKFPTCITGPRAEVKLPSETVDWEVEMVVVIGRAARNVSARQARQHIAGVMVGQDLSDRAMQFASSPPQFSLAKSHEGFGPTGPWITTPDEVKYNALDLSCQLNDETVQSSNTSELLFPVDDLIEHLSSVTLLMPGDLIFTGTPGGVGHGRQPQRYISSGDTLTSTIAGLGNIEQVFVS